MDAKRTHELLQAERLRIERSLGHVAHTDDAEPEDDEDPGNPGTYGLSVLSGESISDERLEARPTAELTVEEERDRESG